MKKLNIFLVIAFICCAFIGVTPRAFAAFAEQPATLVVFDRSGNVTQSVYRSWREPVRWAYHFPDFKMVDNATAKAVAAEKIFTPKGKVKIDAAVMQSIAEEAQLEALVLVMVDDLDSYMVNRFFGFRNDFDDTYIETIANADIYVYRHDGNRFRKKEVYERDVEPMGNQKDPVDIMKWAICKQVNLKTGEPDGRTPDYRMSYKILRSIK